jgi:DNA (cytosine-5)-methyltransferase 1
MRTSLIARSVHEENYKQKPKTLNLFCGIGGNRKFWDNCDVTAVEINPKILGVYQHFYPNDTVVLGDVHEYLLKHYSEFDFIWSSPQCQSHSSFRQNICVRYHGTLPVYADLKLYEEIIFLRHNFKGDWVGEERIRRSVYKFNTFAERRFLKANYRSLGGNIWSYGISWELSSQPDNGR